LFRRPLPRPRPRRPRPRPRWFPARRFPPLFAVEPRETEICRSSTEMPLNSATASRASFPLANFTSAAPVERPFWLYWTNARVTTPTLSKISLTSSEVTVGRRPRIVTVSVVRRLFALRFKFCFAPPRPMFRLRLLLLLFRPRPLPRPRPRPRRLLLLFRLLLLLFCLWF